MRPRAWSALALLGFGSGLPLLLTDSTLKAWLQLAGVDITVIGFFALVQLPYALKFLWAPFLDRYVPPFLGRRRGWLAVTQALLVALLIAMAFGDPHGHLRLLAGLALGLAFVSASQDTVTDAWRTEYLPKDRQAMGTAAHVSAYRLAMVVASTLAGLLAAHWGWRAAYLLMAGFMVLGLLGVWLAEEPELDHPPRTLAEAVVEPFRVFLKRRGAWAALAFLVLYKIGDQLATSLTWPYFLSRGFSLSAVALMSKGVGIPGLMVGGLLSGWWMAKWSLKRGLLVCGLFQILSTLSLLLPTYLGPKLPVLGLSIALENIGYGMGVTVFMTFMMRLCDRHYTATQFALFTSLTALSRSLLASPAGLVVKHEGWIFFFGGICALSAIPGLVMLLWWDRWGVPEEAAAS
ncbi:MAG TPA: MFS transporter [Holophagaceae bacterium]|jgi:PAT family beta-lactamase induction signal transducer AmpG|nr:MFS transporter [Holophagaceae bacterium]